MTMIDPLTNESMIKERQQQAEFERMMQASGLAVNLPKGIVLYSTPIGIVLYSTPIGPRNDWIYEMYTKALAQQQNNEVIE